MPNFASLEPQDVRDYWAHEERDFTPWVADQLERDGASELENAMGLDIELIEREKPVGKYNVDIFARVVDDGRKIVVENQLARSDHDHLGKSIAYAAGVDADIIVWIAPEFNDEHRDAVQWLNSNSRENIDLFAIRIEVWRIEDSSPAVRLNPVEEPSEWKEKAQRSKGELSDRDKLREEFWTAFRDQVEESDTSVRPRKPQARHYYSNPIGIGGFHISYYVDEQENELGLELIIEDDEEVYRTLIDEEEAITTELGTEVYFGELRETRAGNMRSELGVKRSANIEDRESWDEYFDWMLEVGEQFHEVFPQLLRK